MSVPAESRTRRRRLLVHRKFQLRLWTRLLVLLTFTVCAAIIASAFYFLAMAPETRTEAAGEWRGLVWRLALLALIPLALLGWASLLLTHRIAGPMYRMLRTLESLERGDFSAQFQFRRQDGLHELAEQMNRTIVALRAEREMAQRRAQALTQELERLEDQARQAEHDGSNAAPEELESIARARQACAELRDIFH